MMRLGRPYGRQPRTSPPPTNVVPVNPDVPRWRGLMAPGLGRVALVQRSESHPKFRSHHTTLGNPDLSRLAWNSARAGTARARNPMPALSRKHRIAARREAQR